MSKWNITKEVKHLGMIKTETLYIKIWQLEYDINTNKIQTASKNT